MRRKNEALPGWHPFLLTSGHFAQCLVVQAILLCFISNVISENIPSQGFVRGSAVMSSTGFLGAFDSRSKLECSKECSLFTHCNSYAYDKAQQLCYLQVSL